MTYSDDTNIPDLEWTEQGINIPSEENILKGAIQDYQMAFGKDLRVFDDDGKFLLSTPQGQLITSRAALISNNYRLFAYYLNQINPLYAMGRMQDAIGEIYFIKRIPATNTKVVGICTGNIGTLIGKGTLVQDKSGNKYSSNDNYTIGDDGTVEVTFICEETGAIECPANSLTFLQAYSGWESVYNPNPGTVGKAQESQQQFERRRRLSVAKNGVNSMGSIMSSLLTLTDKDNLPICNDVYVMDNSSGDNETTGGYTLLPHSLYVCVDALVSDYNKNAIAKAIFEKKPPGCDMNGDVEVIVYDETQIDGKPIFSNPPSYKIKFLFAQQVQINFNVKMAKSNQRPSNAIDLITKKIKSVFSGDDESSIPGIGSTVLASTFTVAIAALGTWAIAREVKISLDGVNWVDSIEVNINQIPIAGDIEVTLE